MFQDSSQSTSIASSWKATKRQAVGAIVQTDEVDMYDYDVQTESYTREIGIQADASYDAAEAKLDASELGKLKRFLSKAAPAIEDQLEKNLRSHAFDGYEVHWEDEIDAVSCLLTLNPVLPPQPAGTQDDKQKIHCTNLSWNCNGSLLAAAHGSNTHKGWCPHRGFLCAWNMQKSHVNTTKPDIILETSSCVMSVAFHPQQPSLLAGGLYNGVVTVWDLSNRDDPKTWRTPAEEFAHREPVTALEWTFDRKEGYRLVSISGDGRILVWSMKNNLEKPVAGFALWAKNLPKSTAGTARTTPGAVLGAASIAFNPMDQATFVTGTETGGVLKCSVYKTIPPEKGSDLDFGFGSPVSFVFAPHTGNVSGVACSAYHRNVFATCGSDGYLKIYNMLQTKPQLILEPAPGADLYCLGWSTARPLVLAVGAKDGNVYMFDLKQSRKEPVATLPAAAKASVVALQFNPHERGLLASACNDGTIKIWQLNHHLTHVQAREDAILDQLGTAAPDEPVDDEE
eukprot:TRINITY_DN2834_c0_g1_i1.p1 TRINITY_DN2834_c0_g1~~TRINITY_DN2834_c0_g1_i1.p1  ORF type:complete len:512 (+),score=97.55 TRINITY_DN2834_c0_g1_i1:272-1807(+)